MTVKCTGNKTSNHGTCISKIYQTNKIYIRNYMYSKCKTLNCKNSNTDSFFFKLVDTIYQYQQN